MDKWGANQVDINSGSLNSNGESKAVTIPKWTRVPRMECGLDGGCDTQPLPTLGKRGSAKMVGKDYMGMKETRGVKHGKLQEDCSKNSTAGVLDHPFRSQ